MVFDTNLIEPCGCRIGIIMRYFFTALLATILACCFYRGIDFGTALAVADSSSETSAEDAAVVVENQVIRIDIPVSWQLTRSNFIRKGVAARTESSDRRSRERLRRVSAIVSRS